MGYEKSLEELEHVQKHLEKALAMRDIAISQAGESMEISITLAPEMIDAVDDLGNPTLRVFARCMLSASMAYRPVLHRTTR